MAAALTVPVLMATAGTVYSAFIAVLPLLGIAVTGIVIGRAAPVVLPDLCWISLIGVIAALPALPWATAVATMTKAAPGPSLAIIGVAYAAFALSPANYAMLRQSGWRLMVLALVVFAGSFLGSAIVAQLALHLSEQMR